MKRLVWNKSYELGIPELDIQHRILFNIMKILVDSLNQQREREVIQEVLQELNRYTLYHTNSEEKYFNDTPEHQEHREEHNRFKEDVSRFKDLYESQTDKEFVEMMLIYLQAWIENHVTGMDRRDLLEEN
jgi:hemerythrin-like metal-binding protein